MGSRKRQYLLSKLGAWNLWGGEKDGECQVGEQRKMLSSTKINKIKENGILKPVAYCDKLKILCIMITISQF